LRWRAPRWLRKRGPGVSHPSDRVRRIMSSRNRMYPTAAQEVVLRGHRGHARFVYNLGLEQRSWWQPGRRSISFADQCRELTAARAEHRWLADGSSVVQQQALKDLAQAFANFFQRQSTSGIRPFGGRVMKAASGWLASHSPSRSSTAGGPASTFRRPEGSGSGCPAPLPREPRPAESNATTRAAGMSPSRAHNRRSHVARLERQSDWIVEWPWRWPPRMAIYSRRRSRAWDSGVGCGSSSDDLLVRSAARTGAYGPGSRSAG
jgi:hypothetical protein